MVEKRWNIPDSWQWSEANKFSVIIAGGTPRNSTSKDNYSKDGIPWLTPADLSNYHENTISRGKRSLSTVGYENSSARLIPKGSVLFSSRAPIGYCVIADNEISTNQGFKNFVPAGEINPHFLRYYLINSKRYAESKASGTTFLELSGKKAAELSFPIAPLNEQKRIADKIKALFLRSQKAKNALDAIPSLLDQYRQSILTAALRGQLTESLRAELSDPNKMDVNPEYKFPWLTAPLNQLVNQSIGIPYGIIKTGSVVPTGIPTIRAGDIKNFQIRKSTLKRIAPELSQNHLRTLLQGGEVLLSIRGTIGNAAVVPKSLKGCNISREVALIPVTNKLNPHFLTYFLSSPFGQRFLNKKTKGVAQQGVNLIDIRSMPTPIPSIIEQNAIVQRLDRYFGCLDSILEKCENIQRHNNNLKTSILTKAFRGELVPQDPNDEPASDLLKHIKIELMKLEKELKAKKNVARKRSNGQTRKMIIPVIEALKKSPKPLSSQQLLSAAGYPINADTDQIEQFFLDIRQAINSSQVEMWREYDQDYFRLAG